MAIAAEAFVQLDLTDDDIAFQQRVRSYFVDLLAPAREAGASPEDLMVGDVYRHLVSQMGDDGWLTVSWPRDDGGQGLPPLRQLLFFDEADRAGAPFPVLTVNSIGPTLMRHGSDDQRRTHLPRIAAGDLHFSVGYSEPDAGTDLASLATRANLIDGGFRINGQKMWTSMVHQADYVWLACRTDPDAPRHAGISILLVPTDAEGFSWSPVRTLADGITAATFYDDVVVPADHLVGPLHGGWSLIVEQLNHERLALAPTGALDGLLEEVTRWAATTPASHGGTVLEQDWVRRDLARVEARLAGLRLMTFEVAAGGHTVDPAAASATKVLGSELRIDACRTFMEILGASALLTDADPTAPLRGRLEYEMRTALIRTFGGGTNEIQRDIIATLGRGLPRSRR